MIIPNLTTKLGLAQDDSENYFDDHTQVSAALK